MEDSRLMARIAAGDQSAMDEFCSLYSDMLLKFLYKRVSHESAEDLSQIVLLKVWTKATTFRDGAKIPQWLFSIATRTVIDHFRSERRTISACELEYDVQDRDQGYMNEEDRESIRSIVGKLVAKFSFGASVIEDFFSDRTHAESAAMRGVTESTSRWRKTQMRQCLANSSELASILR